MSATVCKPVISSRSSRGPKEQFILYPIHYCQFQP
jgi:hypothetical protein